MSVVVYGYMCHRGAPGVWYAQGLTVVLTFFIGVTRLYAGSRFVHQLVISWACGAQGLAYGLFFVKRIPMWHLR